MPPLLGQQPQGIQLPGMDEIDPADVEPFLKAHAMGAEQFEGNLNEHAHFFGISILASGVGSFLGWQKAGVYGALAGSLFGGTVSNIYRAYSFYDRPSQGAKKEAIISGTYAFLSLAAGVWILSKKPEPEKDKTK